jgi:hypothetical protein
MSEETYINHTQSSEALVRLTGKQAKEQWDRWASDPVGTGMYFRGKKEDGNLAFRIDLGTDMDWITTLSLEKRIDLMKDKGKKNASKEDVQGMAGSLLTGSHCRLGGGALDLRAAAGNLLGAGGESFMDRGIQLPDITAIGMKTDLDDDADQSLLDEQDAEDEEKEKEKEKGKKATWWSQEKGIKDAMQTCDAMVAKYKLDGRTLLNDMQRVGTELSKVSVEENDYLKQETAIMTTKVKALELLFGAKSELDAYISSFVLGVLPDGAVGGSTASSSGSPGKIAHTMGSAPPCGMYEQLLTFAEVETFSSECLCAEAAANLLDVKKKSLACLRALETVDELLPHVHA